MSKKPYTTHIGEKINHPAFLYIGASSFALFWFLIVAFFAAVGDSQTHALAALAVMGMPVVFITFAFANKALQKSLPSIDAGFKLSFLAGHIIPIIVAAVLGNFFTLLLASFVIVPCLVLLVAMYSRKKKTSNPV